MAKNRMVSTKFWSDGWVNEKLNPLDRYLFLYLLTNEHSNLCGIYELPMRMMAFETGIDCDELRREMLRRLEPKVYYVDGWVFIVNYEKYHNEGSINLKKGIESAKKAVPSHILIKIDQILKGIDTLSPFAFAFASALSSGVPSHAVLTDNKNNMKNSFNYDERKSVDSYEDVIDDYDGKVAKGEPKHNYLKSYREECEWAEKRTGKKFTDLKKQYRALKEMRLMGKSREDVRAMWIDMENSDFWKDKTFDFMTIRHQIKMI